MTPDNLPFDAWLYRIPKHPKTGKWPNNNKPLFLFFLQEFCWLLGSLHKLCKIYRVCSTKKALIVWDFAAEPFCRDSSTGLRLGFGNQRAVQTVSCIYSNRTCSRDTSTSNTSGVLNDIALYIIHTLTHTLSVLTVTELALCTVYVSRLPCLSL